MADLSYTTYKSTKLTKSEIKDRWHLTGRKATEGVRILRNLLGRDSQVGDTIIDPAGSVRIDHIAPELLDAGRASDGEVAHD